MGASRVSASLQLQSGIEAASEGANGRGSGSSKEASRADGLYSSGSSGSSGANSGAAAKGVGSGSVWASGGTAAGAGRSSAGAMTAALLAATCATAAAKGVGASTTAGVHGALCSDESEVVLTSVGPQLELRRLASGNGASSSSAGGLRLLRPALVEAAAEREGDPEAEVRRDGGEAARRFPDGLALAALNRWRRSRQPQALQIVPCSALRHMHDSVAAQIAQTWRAGVSRLTIKHGTAADHGGGLMPLSLFDTGAQYARQEQLCCVAGSLFGLAATAANSVAGGHTKPLTCGVPLELPSPPAKDLMELSAMVFLASSAHGPRNVATLVEPLLLHTVHDKSA